MKISIDEYISRQQDGQVLNEAFKAGNRARKKESVQDTVGETNPLVDTLLNEINTEDIVRKYLEKNRFLTVHATFRDIILHVLGRLTNIERGVLNHCLQVYTYQRSGGEFGVINFRTMGSFKTVFEDDRLVFEIKEDEPAKMVADFFERTTGSGALLLHIDTHEAKLGESYVTAAGIGFCLKIVELFNRFREGNDIYEAFRAGNRARRKESVQDAVGEMSVISPQVVSDCVDDAINRYVSDFGSPRDIIQNVRLSLFVTEFVRYLFTELTGSRYASEYLKIGTVPLNDDDTAGDIWIEFWGTTNDRKGVKYSPRWVVSWYVKDGSAVYNVTYGAGADYKEYHRSILFTINDDCSWTPGDGLMGFAEAFAVKTRELWDGRILVPQHPVDEAFRAGNRARRKESVQDTVEGVDVQVTKETCTETVEKFAKLDRFSKIGINDLIVHVMSDTAAEIGGFDKVELFTAMQGHGFWKETTFWTEVKSDTGWFPDICIGDRGEGDGVPGGICYTWYLFDNGRTPGEPVAWHRITPHSGWIIYDRFVDIIRDIVIRARRENIPTAVDEAFRAGNKARKKETVTDTVQGPVLEITCREAVAKLAEFLREPVDAPWNPHEKTSRCMDEDGLDEAIEAAEAGADIGDPYSFEFGISGYSGYYSRGFNFDEDSQIYISICEDYARNDKGVKDKSAGMIQRVDIGCTGVGSNNGSFDLLKQGRSDSSIYVGTTELTPATFASLMELCRVLFPLKGNDSRLSYFIENEPVYSYGTFLYVNQNLLWPWLCQDDRMLVYEVEDDLNMYEEMDEAFRAGNRARKKETAADTVQKVEGPLEKQIRRFEEETGQKLDIVDGRPFTVGPLNLNGIDTLTRLPDGLHVDYYCCISNCSNIEAIPRGLSTRTGALNADHCKNLRYVPADIHINNTIYFDHCPNLESLPEGLKVYRGGIDLSYCTALKSLPENFEVSGPLKVTGCKNLKTLPKGLSVDCLECEHSGLTELPLDIRFNDTGLWAFLRPNLEVSRFFYKITGVTFDSDKQPLMKEIWCRWQQEHGYVDYGIDLSKPLNEGGKAVKGVSPIRGDLALTVANKAASALMQQLPGVKIVPVGSVGKKPADQESGDIDLAVQVPWEQKDLVIQAVQKLVPDAECREFKALWLVSAPWPWREDGLYGRVQLDMFLGPDIRLTQFMRWSPNLAKGESRYKGLYRTALLISIASCIPAEGKQDVKFDGSDCLKDCWRYSLSPRTGLRIVHKTWASKTGKMLKNPKNVDEDTVIVAVDPQIIAAKLLGEGATLNDCVSLESVWKRMQSPQFPYKQYQDQILKEYYKYLQDAGEELPAMKQNEDNTDVKKD